MTSKYIIEQYTNREEIELKNIKPGCVNQNAADSAIVYEGDNELDAMCVLSELRSTFKPYKKASDLFIITEYELCKYIYNDDGEIEDVISIGYSKFAEIEEIKVNHQNNCLEISVISENNPEKWLHYHYNYSEIWQKYNEEMMAVWNPDEYIDLEVIKTQMAEKMQKDCICTYEDAKWYIDCTFYSHKKYIMEKGYKLYKKYLEKNS